MLYEVHKYSLFHLMFISILWGSQEWMSCFSHSKDSRRSRWDRWLTGCAMSVEEPSCNECGRDLMGQLSSALSSPSFKYVLFAGYIMLIITLKFFFEGTLCDTCRMSTDFQSVAHLVLCSENWTAGRKILQLVFGLLSLDLQPRTQAVTICRSPHQNPLGMKNIYMIFLNICVVLLSNRLQS